MRKNLLAALAVLLAASPALAFVEGGITETLGSNHYRGTRLYGDIGDAVHFRPNFSTYRSDISNGTYNTFSGRLGYDTKVWGAGVTAGGTPKTNGYSNGFFGADVAFSFTPTGGGPIRRIPEPHQKKGSGLTRVDLGAGILHTAHRDDLQAATAAPPDRRDRREGTFVRRRTAATIGQTDFSVNGGVSFLDVLLSAELTASHYNRNLKAISALDAPALRLSGLNSVIQGFPKSSANVRLELDMFPIVEPYVSVTRTRFELDQPSSTDVAIGASAGFEILEVHGSLERYNPGGGLPIQNYVALGAGFRF